ncbi:MAG: hypothetical protein IKV38_01875 [Clostridia bacterium]|nr:hypothetical protein [Clostridia bacterium]
MNKTKDLAIISIFTALLLGGQFALSAVSGIEVVTVLFVTFAYVFGTKRAIFVANVFSVVRCLIFGFFPSVLVLYLIYYNALALVIGQIGKKFNRQYAVKKHAVIIVVALVATCCFTLIDNLLAVLFYSFNYQTAVAYWYASLSTLIPQLICVAITLALLFYPLCKLFLKLN